MSVKIYLNSDNGLVIEEANGNVYNPSQGSLSSKNENGRIQLEYSSNGADFKDYAIDEVLNALGVTYGSYAAIISAISGFFVDAALAAAEQLAVDLVLNSSKIGTVGWRQPLQRKKIVLVGDSTTDFATQAVEIYNQLVNRHINSGDLLDGILSTDIVNYGVNGNTLSNFVNNAGTKGIASAISENADMYIICYGINDVRTGNTSQQQIENYLKEAVEKILLETNAFIVLRTPNSFLLDDIGGYNWITPLSNAQLYTDMLWNAYESFRGKYGRVSVLDMQTLIFGRTCTLLGNTQYMANSLHPNSLGYKNIADVIAKNIGECEKFESRKYDYAKTINRDKPYLSYPLALECGEFSKVATGYMIGFGSNYIDFDFSSTKYGDIMPGDILKVGNVLAYDISADYPATKSGANVRIGGQTFVDYDKNRKGMVSIYRRNSVIPNISNIISGTNINGTIVSYIKVANNRLINYLRIEPINPLTTAFTFLVSDLTSAKDIATVTIYSNGNVVTTWNATNAPLNNYLLINNRLLAITCTSTTYTGAALFSIVIK